MRCSKEQRVDIVDIGERRYPDHAIFLAADDAEAVGVFKRDFGSKLIVGYNVQRTTSDAVEIHFRDGDRLSIAGAEDVLVDTVLLSKCDVSCTPLAL